MADYYRSEIRSARGDVQEHRSTFMVLFDALMMLASVAAVTMLLLTFLSPRIFPSGWLFPILGLIAPATYVATLCLMLYWVIRWRWGWAITTALPVVAGLFYLGLFLRPEFRREHEDSMLKQEETKEKLTEQERQQLEQRRRKLRRRELRRQGITTFMTYNVRQFFGPDLQCSRDSLLAWVKREEPDIICFQEFYPETGGGTKALVDSLLEGYNSTCGDTVASVAIYTRYRILRSGRTYASMPVLRSIWADILAGGDTLRIYNSHLHSTAITSADDDFLSRDNFLADTAREEKLRSIVRRYRDNCITRAAQADTIASVMARSPYPRIVCGDFNDTPMSYVYRTMAEGLDDAFREAGKGFSHTYRGFSNTLRIDYVLTDPSLEVVGYRVPDVDYSDHHPVVVQFKRADN